MLLSLSVNAGVGVYKQIWRFFGLRDAAQLAGSVLVAFLVSLVWRLWGPSFTGGAIPLGVVVLNPIFAFAAMTGGRMARRLLHARASVRPVTTAATAAAGRTRVLIVGAGEPGLHVLRELRSSDFEVVGFLDDDRELKGRRIGGTPCARDHAGPGTGRSRAPASTKSSCACRVRRRSRSSVSSRSATSLNVKTSSLPTLDEVISGQVSPQGQLRPVSMEALLGRHSITHPQDIDGARARFTATSGF